MAKRKNDNSLIYILIGVIICILILIYIVSNAVGTKVLTCSSEYFLPDDLDDINNYDETATYSSEGIKYSNKYQYVFNKSGNKVKEYKVNVKYTYTDNSIKDIKTGYNTLNDTCEAYKADLVGVKCLVNQNDRELEFDLTIPISDDNVNKDNQYKELLTYTYEDTKTMINASGTYTCN